MQGADNQTAGALGRGDLTAARLDDRERTLLEYVAKVTLHANQTTDNDVDEVRQAGWSEPQIAEAVYIAALFAFFNRVADAFGLKDPGYQQVPPSTSPEG